MTLSKALRDELEEIRAELSRLRQARSTAESVEGEGGAREQMAELSRMVHQMLEDAEVTIAEHPVATVAGALALGIVIGRLTAH